MMTPMHILALNPHATTGAILALFDANMEAVFERYSEGHDEHSSISGKCPLDVESYLLVVAALCKQREESM